MMQNGPKNLDFWKKGDQFLLLFFCFHPQNTWKVYFFLQFVQILMHFLLCMKQWWTIAFDHGSDVRVFDVEQSKKIDGKSILFKFKCCIWNALFEPNSIYKSENSNSKSVQRSINGPFCQLTKYPEESPEKITIFVIECIKINSG